MIKSGNGDLGGNLPLLIPDKKIGKKLTKLKKLQNNCKTLKELRSGNGDLGGARHSASLTPTPSRFVKLHLLRYSQFLLMLIFTFHTHTIEVCQTSLLHNSHFLLIFTPTLSRLVKTQFQDPTNSHILAKLLDNTQLTHNLRSPFTRFFLEHPFVQFPFENHFFCHILSSYRTPPLFFPPPSHNNS